MPRRLAPTALLLACSLLPLAPVAGCTRRTLTVTSEPPGALVTLNGQEFGRTPVTRDFVWYGTYDVTARLEGYETTKVERRLLAPWWQWPPFDLIAELAPWHPTNRKTIDVRLRPTGDAEVDPASVVARAEVFREALPLGGGAATRPIE